MDFNQKEIIARRKKVFAKMANNSVAIIPAASEKIRSNDTEYQFRQDNNFYYLTLFNEPDAILFLVKKDRKTSTIMFTRPKDKFAEKWQGIRLGPKSAKTKLKLDNAFSINDLNDHLLEILTNAQTLYYIFGEKESLDKELLTCLNTLKHKARHGILYPHTITDFSQIIDELRVKKSRHEIKLIKQAAKISANAHILAMQQCRPNMKEYELEAIFANEFYKNGARAVAYNPIIGGGVNACTLHYTTNNQVLKSGELVLIDAGCEYHNYAADITRTFPINGKFNQAQKDIYQIVLNAQLAGIEACKPNNTYDKIQKAILNELVDGLKTLKLLKGSKQKIIANHEYRNFYMHSSGHFLGLDVHDVGDYKFNNKWRKLEKDMYLTVEPGIYIDKASDIPLKYHNIGIRIEDDILITNSGYDNLTKLAPKEIDDIENLML